jgi:hypothetical protein
VRLIIRIAIHLSPSTTPIKGAGEREVILRAFSNTNKSGSFDYSIGRLEDDNDSDVEIVDPPDILWKSGI